MSCLLMHRTRRAEPFVLGLEFFQGLRLLRNHGLQTGDPDLSALRPSSPLSCKADGRILTNGALLFWTTSVPDRWGGHGKDTASSRIAHAGIIRLRQAYPKLRRTENVIQGKIVYVEVP